jgi:hypothetical protein
MQLEIYVSEKMKHSILPLLFILLLLTSCHKTCAKKDFITKIEVAKGGCLRGCPITAISIDSTLTYNYFGGYKAKLQGYYTGKVTQGYWDTLNAKLKQVDFKKIDSDARYLPLDGEPGEVICYVGSSKKHFFISIYEDDTTDYKSQLFREIAYSYNHVSLYKMKDSSKFDVIFQHIIPPRPKLDQIKFPPPKHHRR